jgi:hypothetical protein
MMAAQRLALPVAHVAFALEGTTSSLSAGATHTMRRTTAPHDAHCSLRRPAPTPHLSPHFPPRHRHRHRHALLSRFLHCKYHCGFHRIPPCPRQLPPASRRPTRTSTTRGRAAAPESKAARKRERENVIVRARKREKEREREGGKDRRRGVRSGKYEKRCNNVRMHTIWGVVRALRPTHFTHH